ncbi:MAG: GNAT family N-acetyltransferase [Defluviitaleaceae bacterium]|nr:GNAT family N-acetyltransferase [Defluviitaleaceae bacterium]
MEIIIREMAQDEIPVVKRISKKAFGVVEGLMVPGPRQALVAIVDGTIAGGFIYKYESIAGRKVGSASVFAVDPAFHGKGIGTRLCEEGIRHLWGAGCEALVTYVRDDNVASWGAFKKNGFDCVSVADAARLFGAAGTVMLYFKTIFAFAPGYDFYVALPGGAPVTEGKAGSGGHIHGYMLANAALLLPILLRTEDARAMLMAFALVFFGNVLAGYVGTLFSKRQWNFRMVQGGAFIFTLISIMSFMPFVGNWYPTHYENTPEFRRDLAVCSMAGWAFLLGVLGAALILGGSVPFLRYAAILANMLIIFRCMAYSPISAYGGGRVLDWNKAVFGAFVAVSIAVIWALHSYS